MDRKILIIVALFFVLVIAWAGIVVMPSTQEISSLDKRLSTLEEKERSRISPMDVQILSNRVDSLEQHVTVKMTRIYPGEKLLDLGRTIEQLGGKYGLKLLSLSPDYNSLHLFREENQISELPIQINFEGRFIDFGHFLDQRADFPFVLRVHKITMDKSESQLKKLTIALNGVLVIGNRLKTEPGRTRP